MQKNQYEASTRIKNDDAQHDGRKRFVLDVYLSIRTAVEKWL